MSKKKHEKRDEFKSRMGFVLACIGSAVGMGNIWLFPSRVSQYGGLTFLIPYFICVIFIGYTGVVGEMALGRSTKSGTLGALGTIYEKRFHKKKLGEAFALVPVFGSLALAIGYSVVVGWIFKYLFFSIRGSFASFDSVDKLGAEFGATASALGNVPWHLVGLIVCFGIMVCGIQNGIEKANKIMMPIFFLIFIFLGIYIFQLDGALDGYKYIFSLDINKMFHPTVWIYALGQAFFSLSIGGSGTVVYGSYLSDAESIPISAKLTSIFDTVAAMLAAFVIISAMATTGSQLSTGGPGLMFIFLPNIFKNMPAGGLISIVFFMAVLFAGLTSLINLFETPIEALQQKFHFSRKKAVSTIAALGVIVGVSIEGVVGGWMDICSIYISPIGAILAAISFFWVCTPDFIMANVNLGNENKMGKWIVPAGKYGFCGLSILVLIFGAVMGGIG